MTRILLAPAILLATAAALNAQSNVRVNVFGGWTFQDKFNISGVYNGYSYSNAGIAEAAHYGFGIEVEAQRDKCIEVFYQNQKAQAFLDYGTGRYTTDVSANYAMIGGLGYAPFSDRVAGYGGINIGAGWFDSDYGSTTKFAWGGKLGLRVNVTDIFGIKVGAQLLSPVQGASGGLYLGTGGAGAGVSTYSTMYQFGFTGGLWLALGS
jgi:hypothetical protein